MPLIADQARHLLAGAYPFSPVMLPHQLVGHPLLSLSELSRAAAELAPELVERRVHDARNGEAFTLIGHGEAAAALDGDGPAQQWIMLRFIERLERYRVLLDSLIDELGDAITRTTGAPTGLKAVSDPIALACCRFGGHRDKLIQATPAFRSKWVGLR